MRTGNLTSPGRCITETATMPFASEDVETQMKTHLCQGLNSHYFHIIGDGKINPIVGVYIPMIQDSLLKVGFFPSPKKRDGLDHGTYHGITVESEFHKSML